MHVHCPTSGLVGTEHREVSPTDRIHNVCTQCTLHIALLHNAHNTLNIAQCTLHRSQCNATAGLIRGVWPLTILWSKVVMRQQISTRL